MKVLTAVAAAGLLALGSLTQFPNRPGPSPDGTMPEVVVTADGPLMVLGEVVVRAEQSAAVTESASSHSALN